MKMNFKTMAKPFIVPLVKRPFMTYTSCLKHYSSSVIKELITGAILEQNRTFSTSDITEYSKLTHDSNPLHFDLKCAQNAGFVDIPVPGMLVASLFPRIIASHFPGAVYVKQTLDFKSPVFVGDRIVGEVKANNIRQLKDKYLVKFATACTKEGDTVVIDGEATAILPTLAVNQP